MAQAGFTPIQLYFSTTAAAVPTAANLAQGELAINIADGKLYYENSSGVVTLLAGAGGAGIVAGSNTQVQYNNSGVFGASANLTFNGTTLTAGGLTTTGTTSTGVLSVTGNTTLGDAAADTVTVNGTITSNLIFTDNTYDIGASGATRPRSGFFGTSLTAGTTINAAGAIKSTGANLVNEASAIKISQETVSTSTITAYGTNASTKGSLTISLKSSDGSSQETAATFNKDGLGVGITPAAKLDVSNGASPASRLRVGVGAGAANTLYSTLAAGDYVSFETNGTEVGRFTSGGQFGVGETDPGTYSKFVVRKDTASGAGSSGSSTIWLLNTNTTANNASSIYFGNNPSAASGGINFVVTDHTNDYGQISFDTRGAGGYATRATIDSVGNVGIGVVPSAWNTVTPVLQIQNTAFSAYLGVQALYSSNAVYTTGWKYLQTGHATYYSHNEVGGGVHAWFNAPSGTVGNPITFTQAMTLDASGNLFLGYTGHPSGFGNGKIVSKQSVANPYGVMSFASSGSTQCVYIGHNGTDGFIGTTYGSGSNFSPLVFQTSDLERGRFTTSGYFKATNDGSYFNVSANYHELRVGTNTGDWTAFISHAGSTASAQYGLRVELTGDPNGTSNEMLYCTGAGTLRMSVRSNGGIANYAANNVVLSDRREKTNFAPAGSYLDKICAIPVQTFNYIDQNLETDGGLTLGVVAQDVQAVAPELVTESNWAVKDEAPKMRLEIYQTDMQYALMKALQELNAKFEAYKASHP